MDITSNLQGHWKLDATTGTTAVDKSGNGNDLPARNTSFDSNSVAGVYGRAMKFDAPDSGFKASGGSVLALQNDITLCAWIYREGNGGVATKGGTGGNWSYELNQSSFAITGGDGTNGYRTLLSTSTAQNEWYHLCGVYDDTAQTVSLYQDGVLVDGPTSHTDGVYDTGANFVIGGDNSGGSTIINEFEGKIDDVRIYSRPLDADDVAALYEAGMEGDVIYNAEFAALQYCDGKNWIPVTGTIQLNEGLVGHWTFGETTGTAAQDSSSNGFDLDALNTSFDAASVPGRLGNAVFLNANVTAFRRFPTSDLALTSSMTICTWAYSIGDNTGNMLAAKGRTAPNIAYRLLAESFAVSSTGGGGNVTAVSTTLPQYTWYHLCGVLDDDSEEMFLYKDGGLADGPTSHSDGIHDDTGSAFTVGAKSTGGTPDVDAEFVGYIDDMRIYNRALSAAEVQALYDMGDPAKHMDEDANLVGWWPLDEMTGTTATDYSGSGNDGTLINGPVWTSGKHGGALDLDGADDYVDLSSTALATTDYNDLTLCAWYKSADSSLTDDHTIYTHADLGPYQDMIVFEVTDNPGTVGHAHLQMEKNNNQGDVYSTASVMTQQWVHICGTRNTGASTMRIYINGREDNAAPETNGTVAASSLDGGPWLGDRPGDTEQLKGVIDDVRIYDRALTADEIRAIYMQKAMCQNPKGVEADILYNGDEEVLQWCRAGTWVAAGPVPGNGGAGCSNPSGDAGDLLYNADYKTPQYCDGTNWVRMGDPCDAESPAPGTVCEDGTVYAGLTPDGNVKMYTTRCDNGMTWDGSVCTGSRSKRDWNNGNVGTSYTTTGMTSSVTGGYNTAQLITLDADGETAGVQAHLAAQTCADLSLGGHDDWYLPAEDELNVLYASHVAIGNFETSGAWTDGWYWSSREGGNDFARGQRFDDGNQGGHGKAQNFQVRCVRKD